MKNIIDPWFHDKKVPHGVYIHLCNELDVLRGKPKLRNTRKPPPKPPTQPDISTSLQIRSVQQCKGKIDGKPERPKSATKNRASNKSCAHCGFVSNPERNKDVQIVLEENVQLQNEAEELIREIADLKNEARRLEKENKDLAKLMDRFRRDIDSLRQDNDNLRQRLSKDASEKLTDGNAQIADLSDMYRPTNLSTMFAEIYDNLWTDAFEALEKASVPEKEAIETLFKTVVSSYNYSDHIIKVQLQNIRSELICPYKEFSDNGQARADSPVNRLPMDKLNMTKRTDSLANMLKEARRVYAPEAAQAIAAGFVQTAFEALLPTQCEKDIPKCLTKYAEKCAELCWFMVLVDPPVALKHSKPGERFDPDFYKEYTKSVKDVKNAVIEINVWPALLLHVSGPVLCKGVAQPGQKESK